MTNTRKTQYALRDQGRDSIAYPAGSKFGKLGIKGMKVSYGFIHSYRLNVWPKVYGKGWKVNYVLIYDLSKIFIGSSGLTKDQQKNAVIREVENGKPLCKYEVKNDKLPYKCDIGKNFDGIAMLIVVVVIGPKKELVYQTFPFICDKISPAVTFVMGFGTEFVIARHQGEFRILEKFYAVRLQDGHWMRAGKAEEAEKKLTAKDLEAIAIFDRLALFKQTYKSEKKIGKQYLDDMFDDMEKKGKPAAKYYLNPLLLAIFSPIYKLGKFLLPNPGENWREASRQFEIVLDPNATAAEKVGGFLGFLGYGAFVILDFVPGSKALKKADELIDGIRGIKKVEKADDAVKHAEKLVEKVDEKLDDVTKRLEEIKRSEPRLASPMEEALQRIQRAKEEGEKMRKAITEGFTELGADEQIRLFRIAQEQQDITELIKFAAKAGNPMGLKQICKATKGWSPRRRWKAFVEWMKLQRMSGKTTQKVKFSDDAQKLIDEGEEFTTKAFFNLRQRGVKAVTRKIAKGLKKVCGNGLSRADVKNFEEAMKKAYMRLKPAQRKYITGIEFSGKSATGFTDEGVKYLNDIDCTIMPIDPKGLADRRARQAFCKLVDKEFKKLTGSSLGKKDIYIYTEWGKGAFNKADEGWPPKLRHVYEKVENKAITHFGKDGTLAKLTLRNEDVIARLPTKEEAEFFCKYALKEFLKTVKKGNPNPKWLHKADKVLEKAGLAGKYSEKDKEIIKKMRQIFVRDPNEIRAGEELLVDEAMEFLRKYAGDTEAAINPIRYIFLFRRRYEARRAYAYVKTLQKVKKAIGTYKKIEILYIEHRRETRKRPSMRIVRVLKTPKK